MMPVYMDSSQPCHMRPQGYYHQGFVNNPQHMTAEAPPPYYGSCVHGNFPAYNAYWPPYCPPQVPYHQCCINHSGFHPPHASYTPHCYGQPPFPVGFQHCHDSDKDVPGKHHCGKCSPQLCNLKNDRGVVIEDHEPEMEKGNQGEALLPVRSTNCPYPIIWIPHENASNQRSSLWSGDHDQPPAEVKAPENMTIQKSFPRSWSGCIPFDESAVKSLALDQDREKGQNGKTVDLPFDMSKLKSLLQGQDMKEAQIQQNKEESGKLRSPNFWIPSRGQQENVKASESSHEDRKKMQKGKTVQYPFDINKLISLLQGQDVKEAHNQKNKGESGQRPYSIFGKREDVKPSEIKESSNERRNLESFPSDPVGIEGQETQNKGREGNFESDIFSYAKEKSSVRNIPVENRLQEPRDIPVNLSENHLPKPTKPTKRIAKNEPGKDTKEEQSLSSSKASRLPPVCLRVDPLPKKRHGGSKSLAPPKQKEESITSEVTNVTSPLCSKKVESRTVPEACNVKCEEANKEMKMFEGSLNAIGTEKESVGSIVKPCITKENREQPAKKTFTEEEAARIIQSRYRGYDVRRWEPVKKLKEIATVREQMNDVKRRIQALKVFTDQHIEEKEIVIVGEMVLNLLLKLDSVQGLHPSIRDYRKSLARELSGIQDKFDSLKNSRAIAEKEAVKEQVEIKSKPNLEHYQLAEETKMVSDSSLQNVLHLSPEENPMSVFNRTDKQLAAEAEEGSGLFETLAMFPKQPTANEAAASSIIIPEKIGEVNTVVPINTPSADGNKMTVTNNDENKTVVENLEEPLNEVPQVVEETHGTSSAHDPENATEVSEAEAQASENEEEKGDEYTVLPSENDVELPAGVIDDETQLLLQDSSSYTHEAEITKMDPETASHKETDVDHSPDNFKDIGQETSEPQDEKEESPETEVIVKEQPQESEVIVKEEPLETEITEHEISKETKKLMEENQQFKETMEMLVKAGREQLEVISKLTGRVKSLEKKLSHKKRTHIRRRAKPNQCP